MSNYEDSAEFPNYFKEIENPLETLTDHTLTAGTPLILSRKVISLYVHERNLLTTNVWSYELLHSI